MDARDGRAGVTSTAAAKVRPVPVPVLPPEGHWHREQSHYPQPLTPAMRSVFLPAVNRAFRMAIEEIGALIETLELAEIGGWVYQRTVPLDPRDVAGRVERSVRAVREDLAAEWIDRWEGKWKPSLAGEIARLAAVPLDDLADAGLLAHLAQARALLEIGVDWHMKLNTAIQFWIAEYALLGMDLLAWDDLTLLQVFGGLSEMTSAPARALAEIARFVRTRPDLLADVEAGASSDHVAARCPEFRVRLADYHSRFGLRIIPYDVAFPTVGEAGDITLRLLRDQLRRSPDPDGVAARLAARRRALLDAADRALGEGADAAREGFFRALGRAERAYRLREEHGLYDRDVPLGLLRRGLLEAGRRLCDRGQIHRLDGVFYLEFREISDALGSGGPLGDLVLTRRGERLWVLSHPGPASFGEAPPPAFPASLPPEAAGTLRALLWVQGRTFASDPDGQPPQEATGIAGVAASAGIYEGPACVVREESEFRKIQLGDVLVCPNTPPAWSMVFPSIGALVTDAGGSLSHAAIIAREYGIPAVVATGNATALLHDGEPVVVDGTHGVVHRMQR